MQFTVARVKRRAQALIISCLGWSHIRDPIVLVKNISMLGEDFILDIDIGYGESTISTKIDLPKSYFLDCSPESSKVKDKLNIIPYMVRYERTMNALRAAELEELGHELRNIQNHIGRLSHSFGIVKDIDTGLIMVETPIEVFVDKLVTNLDAAELYIDELIRKRYANFHGGLDD